MLALATALPTFLCDLFCELIAVGWRCAATFRARWIGKTSLQFFPPF